MFFSSNKFDPSKDIQDLSGKVIIVTGGNAGVGFAAIQHLIRKGAKVYLGARNESKARAAIERLKGSGPISGEVLYHPLDLSDVTKAKASAEEFLKKEERLDILINNAAQTLIPYAKTHHDIQDIMVVNYLSPCIFTHTLLPLMIRTAKSPNSDVRIVNVTSGSPTSVKHGQRFRNRDDLNSEFADSMMQKFVRYGLSKLALIAWTKELQRQLTAADMPISVTAPCPGLVHTEGNMAYAAQQNFLVKHIFTFISWVTFQKAEKGAYCPIFCAAASAPRSRFDDYAGMYLNADMTVGKSPNPSADCYNEKLAKELWATTATILTEIGVWEGDNIPI